MGVKDDWIEDLSIDYSVKQMELDTQGLQVHRENAKAFIDGYNKDGKNIKISIIVAGRTSHSLVRGEFRKKPKLITLYKTTNLKLSKFGKNLNLPKDYGIGNKYIAVLDTIFHIENDPKIWKELCSDGTFDIWEPEEPEKVLKTTKNSSVDKPEPSILLLRIFEIDKAIKNELGKRIIWESERNVGLSRGIIVTVKRPMLTNEEFLALKIHLIETLDKIKNPGKISKYAFDKIQDLNQKETKKLSIEELANKAQKAPRTPKKKEVFSTQYIRNPEVAELAKRKANGICQLCEKDAPFDNINGEPYLEVHHIIWLSKGGPDTLINTVALCPNCHRKMHILDSLEDHEKLRKKAST